ncbi:MAG: hypothetical protein AAF432_10585 [Planctomycetota bacterium]
MTRSWSRLHMATFGATACAATAMLIAMSTSGPDDAVNMEVEVEPSLAVEADAPHVMAPFDIQSMFAVSSPNTISAPDASDVALLLHRVGLEPECVTAAGISPAEVSAMVSNVYDYLVVNPTALASVDSDLADCRAICDDLNSLIRSGTASQEEINQHDFAVADLASLQSQQTSHLANVIATAEAPLNTSQKDILNSIRDNRRWNLPIAYLTKDRTDQQWLDLRAALANERISEKWGETPDAEAQTLLSSVRAEAPVSQAIASLSSSLSAVEFAWNQALEPNPEE